MLCFPLKERYRGVALNYFYPTEIALNYFYSSGNRESNKATKGTCIDNMYTEANIFQNKYFKLSRSITDCYYYWIRLLIYF